MPTNASPRAAGQSGGSAVPAMFPWAACGPDAGGCAVGREEGVWLRGAELSSTGAVPGPLPGAAPPARPRHAAGTRGHSSASPRLSGLSGALSAQAAKG